MNPVINPKFGQKVSFLAGIDSGRQTTLLIFPESCII